MLVVVVVNKWLYGNVDNCDDGDSGTGASLHRASKINPTNCCVLRLFSSYRNNQLASSLRLFSSNQNARNFISTRCKHSLRACEWVLP